MHCTRLQNLAVEPLVHLIVDGSRRLEFEGGRTPLEPLEVRWQSLRSMRVRMGGK